MTTATVQATIADLEAHPGRCELIDGEIIDMAPTGFQHGRAVAQIARLLANHMAANQRTDIVLSGDPGFVIDEQNVRAPDVAVVDAETAKRAPTRGFPHFVPRLAVEVVSPGDTHTEVKTKARMWIASGVRVVWVVDPMTVTVEVHQPGSKPMTFDADERVSGGEVVPGFSALVSELM
jgi:Uma2 family endonuclease